LDDQVLRAIAQRTSIPTRRQRELTEWLKAWLWPHPAAWGALGVAWLAVLLLSASALNTSDIGARQPFDGVVSPDWTAALRQQRALLQSLVEDAPVPAPPPARGSGASCRPDSGRFVPMV
jgi:hypothetical protein